MKKPTKKDSKKPKISMAPRPPVIIPKPKKDKKKKMVKRKKSTKRGTY